MSTSTGLTSPRWSFSGTPAELFFAFGCIACAPYDKAKTFPPGWTMVMTAFTSLQDIAMNRGFTRLQRRQLKGACRRGKATPFAMALAEAAAALITHDEFALQVGRTASWLHFIEHGRPMPGWTFVTESIDQSAAHSSRHHHTAAAMTGSAI